MSDQTSSEHQSDEFAKAAAEKSTGLVRECFDLLRHNKKWWLTPIIFLLLLVGLVVIIGGSAAAPFIYTLF